MAKGLRFNEGKPHIEQIPLHLLYDTAEVLVSQTKYPKWNWTKGMKWSVPYASALRHLAAWYKGEDNDKESGLPHIAHTMCNILFLTHYTEHFPLEDDRPVKSFTQEKTNLEIAVHVYCTSYTVLPTSELNSFFFSLAQTFNLDAQVFSAEIIKNGSSIPLA